MQGDVGDHLPAAFEGFGLLQGLHLPPQHADARRPQHLVSREGEEVDAQPSHVHGSVGDQLGGVDHHPGSVVVGQVGYPGHVGDGAQHVGHAGDRHHLHRLAQLRLEHFHVEPPVVGDGNMVQDRTGTFGHHLPGDQVGVVFHLRGQDHIPFGQVLQPPSEGDRVEGGGRPPGEDHLPGVGGADEGRHPLPGSLVGVGGGDAQGVGAAVDVGVGGAGETVHRLQHLDRLLRRRRRVEEVDPRVEDGEVGLQMGEVGHGIGT